jgi:drug/metabolite transporter (DMT)-like permease
VFGQFAPILLALTSSVLFAVAIQFMNRGLRHTDSETGSLVHIASTTLFYWLLAPWFVESWYWLTAAAGIFAVVGLFKPVLSANCALLGVRYMGPTPTSTLASTAPLFAAAFGVLILGEHLTPPIIAGTVAIMAGCMLLAQRGGGRRMNWPLWALSLPLGAALFRSAGDVLTKIGMVETPSPIFAGLVSYNVSLLLAVAAYGLRRRTVPKLGRDGGAQWFVLAGVINGVSVLSLNAALQLGEVIVVIPLVASSPLVTLLLSLSLFRGEIITRQSLLAVLLVVPGVILIGWAR